MRVVLSLLVVCVFGACGRNPSVLKVAPNNVTDDVNTGNANNMGPVTYTSFTPTPTPTPSVPQNGSGSNSGGGGVIVVVVPAATPTPTPVVPAAPTCTIATSRYCPGGCHPNPTTLYRGGWARFIVTVNGVRSGDPVWSPSPASGASGDDVSHYWNANGTYRVSATVSGPGGSYTCHSNFFTVVAPPGAIN